jgi:hypothetical protein
MVNKPKSANANLGTVSSARDSRNSRNAKKRAAFLDALMKCGTVSYSAIKAKVPRPTIYRWRSADENFAKEWDRALEMGIDALEDEAIRRAMDGMLKPVFHGGKKVGEVRVYSDTLLIFLLKGRKPEKYAERRHVKHSGVARHPHLVEPAEDLKRMAQALQDELGEDAVDGLTPSA